MSATVPSPRSASDAVIGRMLVCSFLWASGFLLMKVIGADIAPLPLTALRGLMGAAAIGLWLAAQGRSIVPRGREWRDWAVLGLFQGIIPNTLTAFALTEITAALGSMIQAATPLIVAVFAHALFADERLTARRAAGALIGFSGMAILTGPAALAGGAGGFWGTLAMVATAVSYAIGNLYVRAVPAPEPARLALGQQIFSGVPTLLVVLAFMGPSAFAAAPAHAVALLWLGLFATALPIVIYMQILRLAGPTRGSMNSYLVPFWAVLMGFAFLGETIGWREGLGGLVVLAGVAIVSGAKGRGGMPGVAARS